MNNWGYFDEKYGTPIGKGAQCQVYRREDTVYKVLSEGHDLFSALHEGYALAVAQTMGIPVSIIHGVYTQAGHIVVEMACVSGKPLADTVLDALGRGDTKTFQSAMDKLAEIQLAIHRQEAVGLASVRGTYFYYVRHNPNMGEKLRENLLRGLSALPDGSALCHNDYHANNVLFDGTGYVIIDWDSAMIGDPAGDVAHSYLAGMMASPVIGEAYLESYLRQSGMDRARIEAWLPLHAYILWEALHIAQPALGDYLHTHFAALE